MKWTERIRPTVLFIAAILGGIAVYSINVGYPDIANLCIVAIAGSLTQIFESEEK